MSPAIHPTTCERCRAVLHVADGRRLCRTDAMADLLMAANDAYRGDDGNRFAYWRHLAAAVVQAPT